MRINKHDTDGNKPLLGKGELGYDDYQAGGDTGRVYVGTGTENIALAEKLEANMMTKAQFNALAEERKANRAGSGFDSFGKARSSWVSINDGIGVVSNYSNFFLWGDNLNSPSNAIEQNEKTIYPIATIGGVVSSLKYISDSAYNKILLPTAPTIYPYDTVLTTEQINSGVIKHADASNSGLIVNGKFDTDTSGWASSTNFPAILSSVNGKLRVTATNNFGRAIQGFPTVIGKKYFIKGQKTLISGTATVQISITNNLGVDLLINVDNIGEFTATNTTTYVACAVAGSVSADAVAEFDNIAVYPADAISRSDLVFLESWHEDISEKNFVYPLGNVQYLGGNTDGLTGIANGAFTGFEQYSLFGNWQTPSALIGKGYVWSNLTESQKRAFIANPENNCYLDGDKVIQVRYRVRVVQGYGDSWEYIDTYGPIRYSMSFRVRAKGLLTSIPYDIGAYTNNVSYAGKANISTLDSGVNRNEALNTSISYSGEVFALPIALVHR